MTAVARLERMTRTVSVTFLVLLQPGLSGVEPPTLSAPKGKAACSVGASLRPARSSLFRLVPSSSARPASPARSAHPSRQESPASQPATLADFAWLEGRWRGDWGPRVAEQVWLPSKAGLMLGTFRLVEDDKTLLVELFSLLQKPDGIEFRFRHFTPDLAPWEKSAATLLTLESFDAKRFVFVNRVNGQPKHAILTRLDQDTYVSRSEILPESGGMQVIEIIYHRVQPNMSGAAASRH
jgi:Domain of unknown function (DUF6265)